MTYEDIKIKINNKDLPVAPTKYDLEYSDLDSSGVRSITDGILRRNRIRSNTLKLSLEWQNISIQEANTLVKLVDSEAFGVEIYDIVRNARTIKTMYAGNKKHSYRVIGNDVVDAKVSFNLIEA